MDNSQRDKLEQQENKQRRVIAQWSTFRLVGSTPYGVIKLERCISDAMGHPAWQAWDNYSEAIHALGVTILKHEEILMSPSGILEFNWANIPSRAKEPKTPTKTTKVRGKDVHKEKEAHSKRS